MRLYVPQDNQIAFYISYSGGITTFVHDCDGTRYDGNQTILRRVTSLLTNQTGAYSKNNKWSNVYIATPSLNSLWQPSHTAETTTTVYTTAIETNPYYNETVNCEIP